MPVNSVGVLPIGAELRSDRLVWRFVLNLNGECHESINGRE